MTEKIIHKIIQLSDLRQTPQLRVPAVLNPATGLLTDLRARPLRDLRISVTDRCNFRCTYCMPKEVFDKNYAYLPQTSLLSFEEITRLAKIFVAHGVEKIRLTGGEPLLRKHLEKLIEQLAVLKTVDGKPLDITLTTNASLLAQKAQALKDAGLQRVTVSLDALDDAIFKRMNDVDFPVADVLNGLEAAQRVGLHDIKVNMVVKGGVNDDQIVPMARHFKGSGMILRFIEFMDVGASNGWRMDDVLPSHEVIQRIHAEFPLHAIEANYTGETAERWQYADGSGEVGVISSVTQAFCGDCTRARLSTEGKLYLCLFASSGHDLRGLMRQAGGVTDAQLETVIGQIWQARSDNYSEQRSQFTDGLIPAPRKVEMSYIGG